MMNVCSEEELRATVDLYAALKSQRKVAKKLGLSQSSVNHRLTQAARQGFYSQGGPFPPGVELKGYSTLYGPNGEVKGQWIKTQRERTVEETVDAIKSAFEELKPSPKVVAPRHADSALLTVYPVADLHLGMYAWDEETGENYDLNIAQDLLNKAVGELVALSPGSETALVLNLGDFFHSDSNENRTRRSGNALDVDTRYAKVLQVGVALMAGVVIRALTKHKSVIVRNLQGNHDPYAALALGLALASYFRSEPRVTVDTSPSPFFFHRHGKVLIGATHGDMVKAEDMPGVMAAKVPEEWGRSQFRYVYCGHWHSKRKRLISEQSGAEVEVFQTLAPRDAWGNAMGFTANRSMVAITHHAERGEVTRLTQTVRSK